VYVYNTKAVSRPPRTHITNFIIISRTLFLIRNITNCVGVCGTRRQSRDHYAHMSNTLFLSTTICIIYASRTLFLIQEYHKLCRCMWDTKTVSGPLRTHVTHSISEYHDLYYLCITTSSSAHHLVYRCSGNTVTVSRPSRVHITNFSQVTRTLFLSSEYHELCRCMWNTETVSRPLRANIILIETGAGCGT